MHELSVTQSILDIALRHAENAGARRITRLNLVIGDLAGIIDESVQFYWDIIGRDTIAEGAELCFERRPAVLRCVGCGHTYPMDGLEYSCPICHAEHIVVVGGKEFQLESIEVE
ncbi:MAG: hydrogenase maturation nickel metallochaperone HypA [Chloroflexi bacterium]|nr:hydrogenase maturation nickel metallochaperone HypA [Chloroflexota bacterium]